jgi:ABC-type branched-subunit amino acid transport system ATPase component
MCAMESYADAIVGIVGEGLNVEQRKRLTIGVELAAKPQLLLFLDEVCATPAASCSPILTAILADVWSGLAIRMGYYRVLEVFG